MNDTLLTATPTPAAAEMPARPPQVPEKFWDSEAGAIRIDALLKSYLELERHLSAGAAPALPEDRGALLRLLGVPEQPDGYRIDCPHGLFEADSDINQRLHAAGFTPDQAQLLYDLAAERLVPTIRQIHTEMSAEMESKRDLDRLVAHFGGEDAWREMSRQLLAWAKKNLPAAAIDGLTTSFDGVLALHRMMNASEPTALRGNSAAPAGGTGEADLYKMMRDPRYWRDRDPAFIAKVTDGFRQVYPDRG
jgi:hypothetical protein